MIEKAFLDTSTWKRLRTLQEMPNFVVHYNRGRGGIKSLSSTSKENGSPHTLVITSAGLRAADITRYVGASMHWKQ